MQIHISRNEAILVDWILTMHSWDDDVLGKLTRKYWPIRYGAMKVLTGSTDVIDLDEDETTDEFIAMLPIIFSVGGEDVGFSLKVKLIQAKFPELKPHQEEINAQVFDALKYGESS